MIYKYTVEIRELIGQEFCNNEYEGIIFAENFRQAARNILEIYDADVDEEVFGFKLNTVDEGNIFEF